MIQKLERSFQNNFNHCFGTFEHVSDQNRIYEQNDFNLDQCAVCAKTSEVVSIGNATFFQES